ncbi:hypothetical protein [Glutamicibacter mysorens]|uniref:hypothetical protein n=1 Tax=Glutamicibacter mysorens TaxID=257984 RepID=UPI0020C69495|nr:hypothetical protein [Glutamicibacter mysorens]UTM47460.1 hypothetical protein XH9_01135 [Glutamicibacter mysorens]
MTAGYFLGAAEMMFGEGLFANGRPEYEKELGAGITEAKVLITVKAAPQPSANHGDTVCVAGLRLAEGGPEWIRLYPIPFRYLQADAKFKKYDIVKLKLTPAAKDRRPESYTPILDSLTIDSHLEPWKPRHPHVDPLIDAFNTCELNSRALNGSAGPSLAAVVPADIDKLELRLFDGWTSEQQAKMEAHLNQDTLFGPKTDKSILSPPRFEGHYRYRCTGRICKGHRQGLLDWEFTELQRRHAGDTDEAAKAAIQKEIPGSAVRSGPRSGVFPG